MPHHPVPWPDAVPSYYAGSVCTAVNMEREVLTKKAPVQASVCPEASSDQASALLDDKDLDRGWVDVEGDSEGVETALFNPKLPLISIQDCHPF